MAAVVVALTLLATPPAELFALPAERLIEVLPGPSLIYLPGVRQPPIFISVLLHGNETSGWTAVRRLLAEHPVLPRSLLLFVGNVAAAAEGVRHLPEQPDFNRIWCGTRGAAGEMVDALLAQVARARPMLAVDVHNNTGKNPHYSVLTNVAAESLGLALLFSDTAVLIEEPDTVLSRALTAHCPAITIEAGPVGDPRSDEHAYALLNRLVNVETPPTATLGELNLYQALARVHVNPQVRFDFADSADQQQLAQDDLVLTAGMEGVNFHLVDAGTPFGHTKGSVSDVLTVKDQQHRVVTDAFFADSDGVITLRKPTVPAMYTLDREVIAQDCLCYFMDRLGGHDV